MICHFINTHCHFDFPPFSGNEEASLQHTAQAGIGKIIVPATETENFAHVLALAENYQPLYATLGLHPGMLEKHSNVSLEQLQQALERHPAKVVAVGEISLDLFGNNPQFERQQWLLNKQLKLAKHYNLPVILHSQHTHNKLAMHLKHHNLPRTGMVHSFSSSLQQAKQFVQLGYKIGIGSTITYPHASKTHDVITKLPLASLLLETNTPDMPLNSFQGQPNHPEQAAHVFTMLCKLHQEPADEIAQALLNNTYTLFNMP